MPQRVEVGEEWPVGSLDDVGDAGGFQVVPEHVGSPLVPGPRPDGGTGRPMGEEVSESDRYVGGQGLLGMFAVLRLRCSQGDVGGLSVEMERFEGQCASSPFRKPVAQATAYRMDRSGPVSPRKAFGLA